MPKRKPMQVTFDMILDYYGAREQFENAAPGDFWMEVKSGSYMRLVIEKVGPHHVSIAHYGQPQNGDAIRDPEIVFDTRTWLARECTQDPVGFYQHVPDGKYSPGLEQLARVWAKNLRAQGFTDAGTATVRAR